MENSKEKKMKFNEKIINCISYKKRKEKKLVLAEEKVEKYMNMSSTEFLIDYTEIKARYEHKKLSFTVIITTVLLSLIMDVWKYFFDFFINLIISENLIVKEYENSMKLFSIVIVLCIIGIVILIIIDKIKDIYKLNKELIFIEEIKEKRNRKYEHF